MTRRNPDPASNLALASRSPEPDPGCEACGASMRRAPELERRIGKPSEQPLWQCGECRHIQVHPTPSSERIASYYLPDTDATKRGRANWAGGAVQVTPSYLRRLRRVAAKRSGTLLDVGFGPGTFLRAAHAIGYRVTGVDLDTSRFKPDFDCELREGTLCAGLFPGRSLRCRGGSSRARARRGSYPDAARDPRPAETRWLLDHRVAA